MAQTQTALINAALEEIGALGSGQTASAEDVAAVEARIAPMLADLQAREIFYVADSDEIDDAAFPWLVQILAQHIATKFGSQMNAAVMLSAESRLRTITLIGRYPKRTIDLDRALVRSFR